MKVYRPKKTSVWMEPKFHLIKKHKWMDGTEWHQAMMVLRVHTWCRKNMNVEQKGGKFEDYKKETHKGQICTDCILAYKATQVSIAPQSASHAPQ